MCVRYVEDGLETMAQKTMHNKLPILCQKSLYTVALFTPIDVAIEKAMGPSKQAGLSPPSDKNPIICLIGRAFKVSQLAKKSLDRSWLLIPCLLLLQAYVSGGSCM